MHLKHTYSLPWSLSLQTLDYTCNPCIRFCFICTLLSSSVDNKTIKKIYYSMLNRILKYWFNVICNSKTLMIHSVHTMCSISHPHGHLWWVFFRDVSMRFHCMIKKCQMFLCQHRNYATQCVQLLSHCGLWTALMGESNMLYYYSMPLNNTTERRPGSNSHFSCKIWSNIQNLPGIKRIMYVLKWRTVSAIMRGLFWCLFAEMRIYQNNTRMSAEAVCHDNIYIILFVTWHSDKWR